MIRLEELTKVFETPSGDITAADRIDMEVPEGQICVLLGPSGCGKTTTMKMVNRLVEPTSGRIFIGDQDVTKENPIELRRRIGYVIQQIGLFPNKTIEDNICAVPDLLGWDRKKSRTRAGELLEMVALDPATFLKRYPKELSGGQQQRVGVVRALAADPPVMLMDEPFGAIDPINREVIQDEFLRMQSDIKKTIMFVSHDIDEAVKMADRIAIFDAGKLIQYDAPDDLLAHPKNAFIADFVGGDRTLKRLRLISVDDVMMKDPPRVTAEDTLDRAVKLMEEHGHSAIVMVGPKGRARGCVYLADAKGKRGKIGEKHSKLPTTIGPHEDLRNAVSSMFTSDETWLACVDEDGMYVGYVTQRAITHMLGATYRDH